MEWIIGDIHGCLGELEDLLDRLPPKDRLIFLGDYIDRGPDSYGVVERLLREKDRSVFLKGNHEVMMMDYFLNPRDPSGRDWLYWANGGETTLKSYGLRRGDPYEELPAKHRKFFESLELFYECDSYIAVHAGIRVRKNTDMKLQDPEDLLWIRSAWINQESNWSGKKVYYGHTVTSFYYGDEEHARLLEGKNSMGLDTGCVFGGCLTALNPFDNRVVQIAAHKAYMNV